MHLVKLNYCSAWLEFSAILDRRSKFEVQVEGIGALVHTHTKGSVTLNIKSIHTSFSLAFNALVIPSITTTIPTVQIDVTQWQHLVHLQLADSQFGTPGSVDMLIGADVWSLIVEDEIIRGDAHEPLAQRTRLGWVVFGPAATTKAPTLPSISFNAQLGEKDACLDELLRNFWKLEEGSCYDLDGNDATARIFSQTHYRTAEGRYVVHIPFRSDALELGDSYINAARQFRFLERRLEVDPDLRDKYVAFMREFADLGHMERVDQPYDHSKCYYIPHHPVTSKFRVVFNASAATSTGISLNDIQLVGPTIQDSLTNIIFRFRRSRIALTADIEKMFRQVLVVPAHRNFQRIIWRESPSDHLGIYRLTTVTYGMACSPYNAVRALVQCAHDNFTLVADDKQAQAARDAILESFYVDDFLTSCDTASEALLLASNVDAILSAGHFKLRKWNSNKIKVVSTLTNGTLSSVGPTQTLPMASVLGLLWDPIDDALCFKLELDQKKNTLTKRHVISEVAQLFDPTGLVAPVVIAGKIFIQTLWSAGLTWDAPLPSQLQEDWLTLRNGLYAINSIRVPRWLGMESGRSTEIHGFCDASKLAYAAVIYAKTTSAQGNTRVSLLTARTKVAPVKGATIPRLELCAARLLAETLNNVRLALGLSDTVYHLWSDSSIVLCWLHKQPSTLKQFISNRVRQIQELTSPNFWHHVRSAQNPADCASRGMNATELLQHRLWWSGPEWLVKGPLPIQEMKLSSDELDTLKMEEKVSFISTLATVVSPLTTRRPDGEVIALTERFSSLQRLLRTVAYVLRWTKKNENWQASITAPELNDALKTLIRLEQGSIFPVEVHNLRNGSQLPRASKLLSLNPYLDADGILRVGGRISKAVVSLDQRCPIILPKGGALVDLIIRQAHEDTLHGGTQLMLHTLRHCYWILNGRQSVKSCLHRCVICRRHRGATLRQQMSSLPTQRVNASRPFIASGVDYCGPFTLRIGTKRSRTTVKTYLAIFICMATKAVHIEVVDDLSSQAFLDAFTRFVSRRGPCRDLYSDNGTAFVGANRLMKEDLTCWYEENNKKSLASMGTHWHFITPSAPHQGGLWEAAVKSAKHHLVRIIGTQSMWHSQMQTLAARIEACLNSRPLTPLYDDPEDKFALSPGDFLVGAPLIAVPEPNVTEVPTNRLKQWQWIRQLHQQFWQRWSDEYLSTLQTRNKWQKRVADIVVGDIVLVRHENLPPTLWRLGRVTAVHPGSDGLVRNVTLQTENGSCTRAVQKICRLVDYDQIESEDSTGQDV